MIVVGLIESYDFPGLQLATVPGFVEEDYAEVEDLRVQIEQRRRQSSSFRHDRQVLAEAEVVVLVQKLRRSAIQDQWKGLRRSVLYFKQSLYRSTEFGWASDHDEAERIVPMARHGLTL